MKKLIIIGSLSMAGASIVGANSPSTTLNETNTVHIRVINHTQASAKISSFPDKPIEPGQSHVFSKKLNHEEGEANALLELDYANDYAKEPPVTFDVSSYGNTLSVNPDEYEGDYVIGPVNYTAIQEVTIYIKDK
jgi:hypothetical protein